MGAFESQEWINPEGETIIIGAVNQEESKIQKKLIALREANSLLSKDVKESIDNLLKLEFPTSSLQNSWDLYKQYEADLSKN